ncbi:MAG: hypothetical protein PGN07_06325 [Aeromicrobium erythreum]
MSENDEAAQPQPEAVTRACRKCSAVSTTEGAFCPQCGTPFMRGQNKKGRRRLVALVAAILVLALAGGGAAYAFKEKSDRDAAAAQADRERAAKRADDAKRAERQEYVKFLEQTITKDAKKDYDPDGLIDKKVKETSCTATGGGSVDDLTALTGTFECIAAHTIKDGTMTGFRYSGTIDWNTGDVTWKLGG